MALLDFIRILYNKDMQLKAEKERLDNQVKKLENEKALRIGVVSSRNKRDKLQAEVESLRNGAPANPGLASGRGGETPIRTSSARTRKQETGNSSKTRSRKRGDLEPESGIAAQ